MEKDFYIGQPLIVKETGEKAVLHHKDSGVYLPYYVIGDDGLDYANYGDLEPSTEFKFSEIIAGLEQGYFEKGTSFQVDGEVVHVDYAPCSGYGLKEDENGDLVSARIGANLINSTWTLVEPRKEMTLEEIEAELGYRVKLKDNGENLNREKTPTEVEGFLTDILYKIGDYYQK